MQYTYLVSTEQTAKQSKHSFSSDLADAIVIPPACDEWDGSVRSGDEWDCSGPSGDEQDGRGWSGDEWDGSGPSGDEWDCSGPSDNTLFTLRPCSTVYKVWWASTRDIT